MNPQPLAPGIDRVDERDALPLNPPQLLPPGITRGGQSQQKREALNRRPLPPGDPQDSRVDERDALPLNAQRLPPRDRQDRHVSERDVLNPPPLPSGFHGGDEGAERGALLDDWNSPGS